MDYEIDIEEHDVLDNPVVKEIFPDISVIKKEITQYYEEEPTIKEELEVAETQTPQLSTADDVKLNIGVSNYQNYASVKPHSHNNIENEKSQPIQSNKIILGSRPISVTQDTSQKLILGSKPNVHKEHDSRNHITSSRFSDTQDKINKKLILGLKSNTVTHIDTKKIEKITHEKVKIKHMKLILQDIKSYLNQNGRYCKQCCRLFLSKKALDIHISKEHRHKIPSKNKHIVKKVKVTETRHKCRICNSYFANNSNLCRHYKGVHKTNISKIIDNSVYKCNICNMKFSSNASLKRHNGRKKHTTNLKLGALKNIKESNNVSTGKANQRGSLKNLCRTASGRKIRKDISIRKNSIPIVKSNDEDQKLKHKAASQITHKVSNNKESVQISSSAKNLKVALIEEAIRPKYITRAKTPSTKDSNLCQHCKTVFPDQKSLIEHMYEILEPKRNSSGIINNTSSISKNEDDKMSYYVCRQCSYYLPSVKSYFTHMSRNHKTESFLEVKKEKFDAQCKYCPFKSSNIATHNKHIRSYHIDLMFLRIENEIENDKNNQRKSSENINVINEFSSFALESVLFECNKCNICFLSSNIARDHKQHTMKMIENWKCSICSLILKEQNKEMHLKQHSLAQPLKVHNINEIAIHNLLYNCTKCAIHFTEKRYQEHYPNCGSDATDSSYCGTCDILIDKMDMIHHKTQHEESGDISDFTIVKSDIMVNTVTGLKRKGTNIVSEVRPKKRLNEQHYCLTYCSTCKSFLSDSGLKNKNHIKGTCAHLLTYPCTECGLIFTSSTLQIHKERHEKETNFRLQDYKFFDLQGIQVLPPIPKYPHCKLCNIHFLKKNDIARHICDETNFLTCDICNIKLSENTYKLHMSFHFYVLRKTSFQNDSTSDLPTSTNVSNVTNQTPEILKISTKHKASEISTEIESNEQMKSKLSKTSIKPEEELLHRKLKSKPLEIKPADILPTAIEKNNEIENYVLSDLVEEPMPNDDSVFVLYTCKTCSVTIESYDEVVKHCQIHYNTKKKQITSKKKCKLCFLKFDSSSYLDHIRKVHSNVSKIKFLTFDPSYFTSKNMIWVKHIFQTLPEEIVKEQLKKSIYQHEHRIQLKYIQRGSSPIVVYKCDSCGNFIDPGCVYRHAENPCVQVRKHPCSLCGLPYISILSRNSHEKLHEQVKGLTKKSLNIILFNQSKDKVLNDRIFRSTSNEYLLYQCRNCDRVVEKSMLHVCDRNALVKCTTCGLLISKEDFKAHLSKHADLGNFCSENFKVILFGLKNSNTSNQDVFKKLSPCFNGMVYDYTLYKCQICEMCLKNNESTEKHTCIPNFNLDRSMCSECDLYFPSGNLRHHIKQHRIDRDYTKENINVITFNNTSLKANEQSSCSINKNYKIKKVKETQNEMDEVIDENVIKITKVYDGKEKSVNDNEKTSASSGYGISVCSNKEINEHYLIKNVNNDYEINELSTDKEGETNADEYKNFWDDNVYNENDSDVEKIIGIGGNNEMDVHDESESLDDNIKNYEKNKNIDNGFNNVVDRGNATLYKCRCGLHFVSEKKAMEHIKKCQPKIKQCKQNCSKCNLPFNPSELFSHLVAHHSVRTHVHEFEIVQISIND